MVIISILITYILSNSSSNLKRIEVHLKELNGKLGNHVVDPSIHYPAYIKLEQGLKALEYRVMLMEKINSDRPKRR